jgi:uncharacterized protein YjbJ (UPF0337 family)
MAVVRISLETTANTAPVRGLAGELNHLQKEARQTQSALSSIFQGVGASIGFGSMQAGLSMLRSVTTGALQAQAEQVASLNSLGLALSNAGNYSTEAAGRLQDYAGSVQAATAFSDDAVTKAMALGASFGMNETQLRAATQAALDYSAATGRDLTSAMEMLGKAFAGNTGGLSKLGITLDEGIPKAERFGAVVEQLNQRFGGAAAAETETYIGRLKQLQNAYGEVQEGVGKLLGEMVRLGGSQGETVAAFQWVADFFGKTLVGALYEARARVAEFAAGVLRDFGTIAAGLSGGAIDAFIQKLTGVSLAGVSTRLHDMARGQEALAGEMRKTGTEAVNSAGKLMTFTNQVGGATRATQAAAPAVMTYAGALKKVSDELAKAEADVGNMERLARATAELTAGPSGDLIRQDASQWIVDTVETSEELTARFAELTEEAHRLEDALIADAVAANRLMNEQRALAQQGGGYSWEGAYDDATRVGNVAGALGIESVASGLREGVGFAKEFDKALADGTLSIDEMATSAIGLWQSIQRATTEGGKLGGVLAGAMGGAKIGSMFGPWGTAIGAAAGGILGLFGGGQQREQERQQMEQMRADFAQTADAARLAGINVDEFFKARNPEQLAAAINRINAELDTQEKAMQGVRDAMDRYGITVGEMGGKFAQQELDKQAMQLLQDYRLLTAAGADHNLVLERMGGSINEYVNSALQAGASIPAAMKPVIDDLIAQGRLLDENGVAYTSAEEAGITFAESLTEGISRTIEAIERLVNAILGVPDKTSTLTVRTVYESTGGGPTTGQNPRERYNSGADPDASHATGTGGWETVPFDGYLVEMHRNERYNVVPAGQGGGGGGNVYNIGPIMQQPGESGEAFASRLVHVLVNNTGGSATQVRETATSGGGY